LEEEEEEEEEEEQQVGGLQFLSKNRSIMN
jgi:hypothetical protein